MKFFTLLSSVALILLMMSVMGCQMNSVSPSGAPQGAQQPAAPAVSLSSSSLTFPATNVGMTATTQTITLDHIANGVLSLSGTGMGISIVGANASSYSQSNQCGTNLAIGASCTITVTFTPVTSGPLNATLSIADNAAGSAQTVLLSGTGVVPAVSLLSPASLTFADTPVGTTAATQAIILNNTGNGILSLSVAGPSISIAGANASSYSQTNMCGTSVAAGASCTITVTFTPAASGLLNAALSITDNAAGSVQTVALSGNGITSAASSSSKVYFVDNAIPDINVASSTPDCTTYNPTTFLCAGGSAIAYATIADINAVKPHPGDQILFRRGEIWREQLTPNHNYPGAAGEPVIFGAYGDASSALPIISGANLFSNWTATAVSIAGSSATVYSAPYSTFIGEGHDYSCVPYANAPDQVFEDGSRLSQNTSSYDSLAIGQWYLDATNSMIWVRLVGDDNPSAHTMEASQRDFSIEVYGVSYLNISNLQTEDAEQTGINLGAGADNNVAISEVVSRNNFIDGIAVSGSANDTIKSSTVAYNGGMGVFLYETSNALIDSTTIHDNGQLGTTTYSAGIKGGGSTMINTVIQNNLIYSNGIQNGPQAIRGIDLDTVGEGTVIRYNKIYSNGSLGIELDADSVASVYGNLIYNNGAHGIMAFADSQPTITGILIYNNTIYGNQAGGVRFVGPTNTTGTCVGNAVINNIIVGTVNGPNLAATNGCQNIADATGDSGSGNVYTFNALGVASKNFIEWGSDPLLYESTYEAWETAVGNCGAIGCSHSVESDPLFTDTLTNDFTLSSHSPAIGAGLNLGETYEENLSSVSTWPSGVYLDNQNNSSGGWSIGAYAYY